MSRFLLRFPLALAVSFPPAILIAQQFHAGTAQSPDASPRLLGLDRLYFEHLAGRGDPLVVSRDVAEALPEQIQPVIPNNKKAPQADEDETLNTEIRDFPLPLRHELGNLSLRQVIQARETSRITDLWWALYHNGRRTDVWYFRADPDRTEQKLLSNYEIDGACVLPDGNLELRVLGTMFRPQGAFWIAMKILNFQIRRDTLDLFWVQTEFFVARDYDLGGAPSTIGVLTELEVGGRFEIRTRDNVSEKILKDCGLPGELPDSMFDDAGKIKKQAVAKAAMCVTQKRPFLLSYRGLNDPSFVERGGKAPRWK